MDTCALPSGLASDVRSCTLLIVMRASVFLIRCWAHCASTAIAESMFARETQKDTGRSSIGFIMVIYDVYVSFVFCYVLVNWAHLPCYLLH